MVTDNFMKSDAYFITQDLQKQPQTTATVSSRNICTNCPTKKKIKKVKKGSIGSDTSSLPLLPIALTNSTSIDSVLSSQETANASQYQSCDRCRSKKIKCTYEKNSLNQCISCKFASLECRNTDKLLRRSSPRGYTALLEETCRNLEIEIKKLKSMYENCPKTSSDLYKTNVAEGNWQNNSLIQPFESGEYRVSVKSHDVIEEEESKSFKNDFNKSSTSPVLNKLMLDIKEAPGLTASKILQANQKGPYQIIPVLVSLAEPRSTIEVLFSTHLIAKIGLNFGFLNRECLYTSKLLSSLKDDFEKINLNAKDSFENDVARKLNSQIDLAEINEFVGLFEHFFCFDNRILTFKEIEDLIEIYFKNWSTIVPIFLKLEFLKTFHKFKSDYNNYKNDESKSPDDDKNSPTPINYKIFMCKLLVIVEMGLLSINKPSHKIHNLVKVIFKNPFFRAENTSVSTLQFLTLCLHFFSSTTPEESYLYHLRSLTCMMVQQLRLQRCPQSIVNAHGQQSSIINKRTRRLLFWSNYLLDCSISVQLGVPRLIKDEDSEVLLPFDEPLLEGVDAIFEPVGLQIIKFGVILGGILDGLFKKFNKFDKYNELYQHEVLLENWYRNLPEHLKFDINPEGSIDFEILEMQLIETRDFGQFNLMFVYFFCKSLINLTLISIGGEKEMELTKDQQDFEVGGGIISPSKIDSYIKLHQYSEIILQLVSLGYKLNYKITLPLFIPNLVVKYSLLGLERALEYKKSCELFLQFRKLVQTLVGQMIAFKKSVFNHGHGNVGSLSWYSLKLFDITLSLLLLVNTKEAKETEEYFKKRIDYKVLKLIRKKASFYESLIKAEVGINVADKYNGGDDKLENAPLDKTTKYNLGTESKTSFLSNIEKFAAKPLLSEQTEKDDDDDDDDDDNGLEFKSIPMSQRLSKNSISSITNSTDVKKENSNELDDADLEKYSMKWDGTVKALPSVFKRDPVLSFGNLNNFFDNNQTALENLQNQQSVSKNTGHIQSNNFSSSKNNAASVISSTKDISFTYSDKQLSAIEAAKQHVLIDDETVATEKSTKRVFSNVKHAVYNITYRNDDQTQSDTLSKQTLVSPSEALLTKLSNNNASVRLASKSLEHPETSGLDWTESSTNMVPFYKTQHFGSMFNAKKFNKTSVSKINLLEFGFDNIDSNLFNHNDSESFTRKNNTNYNNEIHGYPIQQKYGYTKNGISYENNNSFIFDGSMGLAQLLDMPFLNNNKRPANTQDNLETNENKKLKK
ncbi:hypothetical protein QEN19_003621 [Hanseniaspora menglaensis]